MSKTSTSSTTSSKAIQRQLYSELFPQQLSKSDKRKIEILEGAIKAFGSVSYEHVSFDDVAGPARTSRRLVQHYFPRKDELFETTMKLIRGQYQAFVIAAFTATEDSAEQLDEYVRSAVTWAHHQPVQLRAWILYFLVSAQQKKFRTLHEGLADVGAERIGEMVKRLQPASRRAEIAADDLLFVAKSIQRIITGSVIEICSERVIADHERIANEAVRATRLLIKGVLA